MRRFQVGDRVELWGIFHRFYAHGSNGQGWLQCGLSVSHAEKGPARQPLTCIACAARTEQM